MTLLELTQLLESSGNVALLVSVYFIYKASERLSRIEKALEKYMDDNDDKPHRRKVHVIHKAP